MTAAGATTILFLLLTVQEDRAERFFSRMKIDAPAAPTEAEKKVLAVLTAKASWIAAFRSIEKKLAPFPDELALEVTFGECEGMRHAAAAGEGTRGLIRFDLAKLIDYQKAADEIEGQRKESERRGRKTVYRVPPGRLESTIAHELCHVLQRSYEAPQWFLEGMAEWITGDLNSLCAFAVTHEKVEAVDAPFDDPNDSYGRGHLFWKWLEAGGVVRKAAQAAIRERRDWKEALEGAAELEWAKLVAVERSWSDREAAKLRPKKAR